jgi:hypothetical protein
VHAIAGFIVRLVGYALVLGVVDRAFDALWVQYALDGSIALQPFHDLAVEVLYIAPLPLALLGFGALRRPMLFIAAFLVGAALTAPWATAHFAGI